VFDYVLHIYCSQHANALLNSFNRMQVQQQQRRITAARVHLQTCISNACQDRDAAKLDGQVQEFIRSHERGGAATSNSSNVSTEVQSTLDAFDDEAVACKDLLEDAMKLVSEIRHQEAQEAVLKRLSSLVDTATALSKIGPATALGDADDAAALSQISLLQNGIREAVTDAKELNVNEGLPIVDVDTPSALRALDELRAEISLRRDINNAQKANDANALDEAMLNAQVAGLNENNSAIYRQGLQLQSQNEFENAVRSHITSLENATNTFLSQAGNDDDDVESPIPSSLASFANSVKSVKSMATDDGTLSDAFLAELVLHCEELIDAEQERHALDAARSQLSQQVDALEQNGDFEGIEQAVSAIKRSKDPAGFRDIIVRAERIASSLRSADNLLQLVDKLNIIADEIPSITDVDTARNRREALAGYNDAVCDMNLAHDHALVRRIRQVREDCDQRLQQILATQALTEAVTIAERTRDPYGLQQALQVAIAHIPEEDTQVVIAQNLLSELRDEPIVAELVERLQIARDDAAALEQIIVDFEGGMSSNGVVEVVCQVLPHDYGLFSHCGAGGPARRAVLDQARTMVQDAKRRQHSHALQQLLGKLLSGAESVLSRALERSGTLDELKTAKQALLTLRDSADLDEWSALPHELAGARFDRTLASINSAVQAVAAVESLHKYMQGLFSPNGAAVRYNEQTDHALTELPRRLAATKQSLESAIEAIGGASLVTKPSRSVAAVLEAAEDALAQLHIVKLRAHGATMLRHALDSAATARDNGRVPQAVDILRKCIDECRRLELVEDQSGSDVGGVRQLYALAVQLCSELEDSIEVDRVVDQLRQAAKAFQVCATRLSA